MLFALWQSSTALVRSEVGPSSAFSRHSFSSLLASTDGSALAGWASANNIAPPSNAAASNLRMRMARPFLHRVSVRRRPRGTRRGRSDELEDETDQGERLGERDAEEHRRPHVAGHLGLAGHRLHRLTDEVTDTDAGADGGETVTDRTEAGLEGVRLRHRQAHELVHFRFSLVAGAGWMVRLGRSGCDQCSAWSDSLTYTAVRMVKMYACSRATRNSKVVMATRAANGRIPSGICQMPLLCSMISSLVMMQNTASSTCPAAMLAKSRTASENGRMKYFERISIGTTRMSSALGTPDGTTLRK